MHTQSAEHTRISCSKVKRVSRILHHTAKAHEMRKCLPREAEQQLTLYSLGLLDERRLLSRAHAQTSTHKDARSQPHESPLSPNWPLASALHFHSGAHPRTRTGSLTCCKYMKVKAHESCGHMSTFGRATHGPPVKGCCMVSASDRAVPSAVRAL